MRVIYIGFFIAIASALASADWPMLATAFSMPSTPNPAT
jgi:hypothetical protein